MATAFDNRPKRLIPQIPFIHPDDMGDRYALTGVGTCMMPLIEDGAILAFDQRERPEEGDLVGVIFTREAGLRQGMPGMVKRLVSLPFEGFEGLIIVEQINPHRRLIIPSTDVLAVHKMIGTATPKGNGLASIRVKKDEAA